jgi:hypothetical protein
MEGCQTFSWERNAMQTNLHFTQKFAPAIVAGLDCYDRVIFKGHLPFGSDGHLNAFVDGVLRMRRKDFLPFVEQLSQDLVDGAKKAAADAQAPYQHYEYRCNKEAIVRRILQERPQDDGLVAVLCCKETCRTVKLAHGQGRPRLYFAKRPQRVLYFYFLDPQFGLMHVRIQTWFSFTIQVYVNGHEWLARQMLDAKIGFVQQDNAFTQLDDPQRAQQLADRFPRLRWVKLLDAFARRVTTPLRGVRWLRERAYYWVIDQAEYSTDLLFKNRAELAALFPRLVEHALLHFSAADILTFLGRRLHPLFDGEVLTVCKKERIPGTRIKHRMKNNWLKMYDKFGLVLRVETVINQPREFRVRRRRMRQGREQMVWCPMNKGVANFYHYHEVAHAANHRYLNALAVVDAPTATHRQLDRLSEPATFHDRRRRGLNLLRGQEQKLFRAVLQGDLCLQGIRNRDVADALYGRAPKDLTARRRRTVRVSRLLQLLRAHGLIAKIAHSHRYRVTDKGMTVMSAAVYARHKLLPKELDDAA